jgi:hypothetical protein
MRKTAQRTDFSRLRFAVHIWDEQQQFCNVRATETLNLNLKTLYLEALILGGMRAVDKPWPDVA